MGDFEDSKLKRSSIYQQNIRKISYVKKKNICIE